jgi:hypothetical protein
MLGAAVQGIDGVVTQGTEQPACRDATQDVTVVQSWVVEDAADQSRAELADDGLDLR